MVIVESGVKFSYGKGIIIYIYIQRLTLFQVAQRLLKCTTHSTPA